MREVFDAIDHLIDILEVLRKTAPKHELSDEQKKYVSKKIEKINKKLEKIKKELKL